MGEALEKAKIARLQILDVMDKAISAPRADINPNAPKILQIMIDPDKIGLGYWDWWKDNQRNYERNWSNN